MEAVFEDIFSKDKESKTFSFHSSSVQHSTNSPNWHSAVEFLYFSEGEGTVYINTTTYEVKKGDIIFVNSKRIHQISTPKKFIVNCLIVSKTFLEHNGFDMSKTTYQEFIRDKEMESLFTDFINQYRETKDDFYQKSVKYAILRLFIFLSRHYKSEVSIEIGNDKLFNSKRIMRILQYIEDNVEKKITIDDLSSVVHISKYYLIHEFKRHTGHTINEMINVVRCDYAKNLMTNSNLDLSTIAFKSGFNTYQYFSNTFKKHVGCTPTEYKNSHIIVD